MSEPPFRRVVLLCDAACDIQLAVTDAAALAARWGAALHGVFIDDENLRRFAALPFGQLVSLSCAAVTEELSVASVALLSSALGAAMRRTLAEAALEKGLEWTFGSVRDLPSAARLLAEEGDILVVESARAFSGAWRPRLAWERSPAAFSGTVLLKGRGSRGRGIVVVLPAEAGKRDKVLSASAAVATGEDDIFLAGDPALLGEAEARLASTLPAGQKTRIKHMPLKPDRAALTGLIARRKPALIVVQAADAEGLLGEAHADVLIVR